MTVTDGGGSAGEQAPGAQQRVLVVDDEADVRDAVAEILRTEGYDTTAVSNGSEALALLKDAGFRPAAIVLDLMMPVMNGWEFLELKRRDPVLSPIPVIVISASGGRVGSGASIHLDKPFESDALLSAVRRCIAASVR
jgi:CheY-like chemotaxis protein